MNLETKITIYKFTPQVFTLTPNRGSVDFFTGPKYIGSYAGYVTSKNFRKNIRKH